MTLLMLLMCSVGAWADDDQGGQVVDDNNDDGPVTLYLKNGLENATVTFYLYPPESNYNTRAVTPNVSIDELKEVVSVIESGDYDSPSTDKMKEYCPYVIMHIVPKDNCWTNKALLFGSLAVDESLVNQQPAIVGPGQVVGPQTRAGVDVSDKLDVNLIQLDAKRYDGAGWYYMYVNEEATEYDILTLDGFVLPKFDLNKGTASTDGKTYTFTVEDVWTTTLTIDEGKTEFTYNGSAQGPTKITNTSIVVKNGSEEAVSFENVIDHVTSELGLSANLTEGKAVNVGSYALTLMSKEVEVTAQSANTRSATTSTVPTTGIFINKGDIEFKISEATFTETEVTAEGYEGVYDAQSHTIMVTAPKSATVKYGTVEGTYNLTEAPPYTNVSTNTVYYQVTMDNYKTLTGSKTVKITAKPLTITAEAKTKTYGEADPALTYTKEGLLEGDAISGALTRAEGNKVGEYAITQGTLSAGDNYTISFTGAKLTIKKAPLSVKAEAQTKEAGEDDPPLTYTYEGLVAGDTKDVFTGALERSAGEEAGEYAIMLGTLSAGDNYDITFTGANLTITATEPEIPDEPLYKIVVLKSEGGEVITTHTQAKKGQQVNIIVKTKENYSLETLAVVNSTTFSQVPTGIAYDKDKNVYTYFLMPGADVTVAATFVKQKPEFKQNIFIFRNYYGEVVSNLLYAEPGQQVNLETREKNGYKNVVLDELFVLNDKGEQLQLFDLVDPDEGPVHLFFMKGEKAYVYNSFKGTNGITDETKSLRLDGIKLFSLSDQYSDFLKTSGGAEGAELVLSFLANILANFTSDGALHVNQGPEDMYSALMNLQSGWKVKFDFTGIIQLLNPELLGKGEGTINLTSGQIYDLLSSGNLKLLMKSSEGPLLINSITVIAPDSQDPTNPDDPTAISGMQVDKAAVDIFDLRGRKADVNTLQKGVYIRDGKKVVIK